ncbi:TPA: hypothetical protein QCZ04_005199 [Bacillus cereus]|uniref:hypothetical protein n=1 Tax=Bacillus cereus group sp. FL70 TaxID=3040254 RepID=UPI0032F0D7B5|nr:hypothetical protein [Bacillus cereus]
MSLKIVHFGRYGEGDTDIVKSILLSLYKMNHIIQEWNTDLYPELLYNPYNHRGGNGPVYIQLEKIKEKLINFKPDLIICNAGGHTFSTEDMN